MFFTSSFRRFFTRRADSRLAMRLSMIRLSLGVKSGEKGLPWYMIGRPTLHLPFFSWSSDVGNRLQRS